MSYKQVSVWLCISKHAAGYQKPLLIRMSSLVLQFVYISKIQSVYRGKM